MAYRAQDRTKHDRTWRYEPRECRGEHCERQTRKRWKFERQGDAPFSRWVFAACGKHCADDHDHYGIDYRDYPGY